MKRNQSQTTVLLTLLTLLILSVSAYGMKPAYQNLENGIKSSNPGLKKSSIYLAGKYEIKELLPVMREELKTASDPELKKLMIRAIYKIDAYSAMKSIIEISSTTDNKHIRKLCEALNADYNKEMSAYAAR